MWAQHNNRNLSKWKQETEEEVRVTQCENWLALKIEEGRSPLKRNRKEGGEPETEM